MLRQLIFKQGYIIYRDLFPGQLYYPYLWHPQGSFLAIENYKFVTFTGLFLPLRTLGLDIYEKAIYVSAVGIAYLALYIAVFRLLRHLKGTTLLWHERHIASALAALTYVANPAAVNIFFDFSLFVGYAFAPFILLLFMEMLDRKRHRGRAILGVAVLWWLSAIKAHWIIFGALLLLPPLCMWGIWHRHRRDRAQWLWNGASVFAIILLYLLLSTYWLIPFLLSSQERFIGSYAPITFESINYLSYTPLYDTVRLLGTFPAWPYVPYTPPTPWLTLPWVLASWAIPVLAVFALIEFRKHWQVWALAVFALAGMFLAKGVAPPLGGIYTALVFGKLTPDAVRWVFRVASKWNVFLSLGYSWLIGLACAILLQRARNFAWRSPWANRQATQTLLVLAGYVITFLFFAWPSFTGDFNGTLVPAPLPDSLNAANQWLADQEGDFKVNWMPVTNGRELDWNTRPSGDLYTSLSSQPAIATNWNRHPVLYYSYAYDTLTNRRTANFGQLLSILNTRFVAYHDDLRTTHIHEGVEPVVVLIEENEQALTSQMAKQRDMRIAWEKDSMTIYEVEKTPPPLFIPQHTFLSTGDLTSLTSLCALEGFQATQNAIVFDTSRSSKTFAFNVDGLLLHHDAADHVAFAMLPAERLWSAAQHTWHNAVAETWSRLDVYQFDWQFTLRNQGIYHWGFDYGKGMVAYDSQIRRRTQPLDPPPSTILNLPIQVSEPADYYIWVRHLRHPHAAEILLSLDGQSQGVLVGKNAVTGFVWEPVGPIPLAAGRHTINLHSRNGFTAINTLALITEGEMAALRKRSQLLAAQIPNIYILEAESDFDIGEAQASRNLNTLSAGRGVVLNANMSISTTLDLLNSGHYSIAIRTASPVPSTPLTLTLGHNRNLQLMSQDNNANLNWRVAEAVSLERGPLPIHIQTGGTTVIDAFILYTHSAVPTPDLLFQETHPPAEIHYEQVDPTRYRVRVHAERPFILALAETYDPLWTASAPGMNISSIPLYGVINGFHIDRVGTYEILVEYQAQQWARIGALFTFITLIGTGLIFMVLAKKAREFHAIGKV